MTADSNAILQTSIAVSDLKNDLERALGNGVLANSDTDTARARISDALCAVAQFLKHTNARPGHVDTFFMVAEAIGELDVGSVHPLLKSLEHPLLTPHKPANRSPDLSEIARQRAQVALALVALHAAGRNKQQAATYLAQNHKSIWSIVGRKGNDLKAVIIEWDKAFRNGTVSHSTALQFYRLNATKVSQSVKDLPPEVRSEKAEELADRMVSEALGLTLSSNPKKRT